jgi:1-deoxy-D-xylulose-5-phosphate synthase
MRVLPNLVVMAPGDAGDLSDMLEMALHHDGPCSIRYPKAVAETIEGRRAPIELGRAEVLEWGDDGCIVCCGVLLGSCLAAVEQLRKEGLDVGVINARFVKPLDAETILRAVDQCRFVVTVEEAALMCGFGSAVLEAAAKAGLDTRGITRLGIPDEFIEHGDRGELLSDLGLDAVGIAETCRSRAAEMEHTRQTESQNLT